MSTWKRAQTAAVSGGRAAAPAVPRPEGTLSHGHALALWLFQGFPGYSRDSAGEFKAQAVQSH